MNILFSLVGMQVHVSLLLPSFLTLTKASAPFLIFFLQFPSVIELNVGGTFLTTRLSTLRKDPDWMLASMFSGRYRLDKDSQGCFFIDRDPALFRHVLNFLRHDKLPAAHLAVELLEEAEYYQLQGFIDWCKQQDCLAVKDLKEDIMNYVGFSLTATVFPVRLRRDLQSKNYS